MDVIALTQALVAQPSVSRDSNRQVSQVVADRLNDLQFEVEWIEYQDQHQVPKVCVVGRRGPAGSSHPAGLAYFGHSDVVPADSWSGPSPGPFVPTVVNDRLYGRGACDMKGSLAAMLVAAESLRDESLNAPFYFVCTADEEIGYEGARQVVAQSSVFAELKEHQTPVIIGEPTELKVVHAHKGICGIRVVSYGQAAHSSSHEGKNANLAMIPFLQVMKQLHDDTESLPEWQNCEFDPPSMSWNIGINDFTTAINMKPAQSVCTVLFRPVPGVDIQPLLDRAQEAANAHGLEFNVFRRSEPVYTSPGNSFVRQSLEIAGQSAPQTVAYGTDGSELRSLENKIVCGPGSIRQAHTADEWIHVSQLQQGVDLYGRFLRKCCLKRRL